MVWAERETGSVDGPTGKEPGDLSCCGPIGKYRKVRKELVRVDSKER
jgi:hypothetical protein